MLESAGLTPITKASPLAKDCLAGLHEPSDGAGQALCESPDKGLEEGKELEYENAERKRQGQTSNGAPQAQNALLCKTSSVVFAFPNGPAASLSYCWM
jgi:hypothetical protein